jgi:ABC-2 type transport system permease protein
MRGWWPIFKRELFAFFVTPLAWVVMTAFLLLQGLHFYLLVAHFAAQVDLSADSGPVQTFFGQTIMLYIPLLCICPLLTMKLFAEERRSGSIESLMTVPVSTSAVVLGKYGAAFCTYLAMWAPTLLYMVMLDQHGYVDWQVAGAGYLASIAVGAGYLAIGTMTSAIARTQLSGAIMGAMLIMLLFLLGIGEFILGEGAARDLCGHVSVWAQMNDFSRGIVDSRRLVFNATVVVLPLFITVRLVDAWRLE